jgi:hypothetical protein
MAMLDDWRSEKTMMLGRTSPSPVRANTHLARAEALSRTSRHNSSLD